MDLFQMNRERKRKSGAPLADRMRPEKLEEIVGQEHLLGDGKFLRRLIESDRLTSMIFYGPPGTGKTTIAEVIAGETKNIFRKLSAVTSGVKDLREVVDDANRSLSIEGEKTILFIDEIHRFNKAQQDALLPFVEQGIIILIGATTENPYFEVNKALVSRCQIVQLYPLKREALVQLFERALNEEKGLGHFPVALEEGALEYLAEVAGGDARIGLNSLEVAVLSTKPGKDGKIRINPQILRDSMQQKRPLYDKDGDEHYNTVSAFIKSMRGTDPDAVVYYLAKMIDAGEDPKFIARRIFIAAAEDVGNADPIALSVASAAFHAVEVLGMPEAKIPLAQAAIYVATAPKSNGSYIAIKEALADMPRYRRAEIPSYLKDAGYEAAKKLGHGIGYLYPHDYEDGYVSQEYLPEEMRGISYYRPTSHGYESQIKKQLEKIDYFNKKKKIMEEDSENGDSPDFTK